MQFLHSTTGFYIFPHRTLGLADFLQVASPLRDSAPISYSKSMLLFPSVEKASPFFPPVLSDYGAQTGAILFSPSYSCTLLHPLTTKADFQQE